MSLTNFPNGISSFGIPVLGVPAIPPGGNVFFLDPAHGSDSNDGKSPNRAFATLETAYAALVANQNDVLFYIAGSSGLNLSAAFTWAKNYTHFIGLGSPTGVGNRARIFQLSTLTGASPLFTISASGCIFANWYIFQGVDDATSLINVQVTGGRNYFSDVHFAGGGHDTMAIDGCASLSLNGAEENRFVRCTLGVDTIALGDGGGILQMDGEAHRNIFEDCHFSMWADNAGARFIEVIDATGIDRYNIFKRCLFTNTSATTLTSGVVAPAGMGAPRRLYMIDSWFDGITTVDANDRGIVRHNLGAVTAAAGSGLIVASTAS